MNPEKSKTASIEIKEKLLSQVREKYIEELEKMVTNPKERFSKEELESVNEFVAGKRKIPKLHKWFYDLLIRVGQDFRLTPDKIDILIEKFLE